MVLSNKDYLKVQQQYASLDKLKLKDIEKLRQIVLDSGGNCDYALITTFLAYATLRISKALSPQLTDFNLVSREITV